MNSENGKCPNIYDSNISWDSKDIRHLKSAQFQLTTLIYVPSKCKIDINICFRNIGKWLICTIITRGKQNVESTKWREWFSEFSK